MKTVILHDGNWFYSLNRFMKVRNAHVFLKTALKNVIPREEVLSTMQGLVIFAVV